MELTHEELELIRQWFGCVEDINPEDLNTQDYDLAAKVYEKLGRQVPASIGAFTS